MPVSSASVKKASLPITLREVIRPAMDTSSCFSSPFGKSAYFSCKAEEVSLDLKFKPYGPCPMFFSVFAFSRRVSLNSDKAIHTYGSKNGSNAKLINIEL